MTARPEVAVDHAVRRQEALDLSPGLEALHLPFSSTGRSVRVLGPVVQVSAASILDLGQDLAMSHALALQAVGDDAPRPVSQAPQQPHEEALCRSKDPLPSLDLESVAALPWRAPVPNDGYAVIAGRCRLWQKVPVRVHPAGGTKMLQSDISHLTELVDKSFDQRAEARTRTSGSRRVRRAFADLLRYGPNYAAVNLVASSPRPIDPKKIWNWFTWRRSRWAGVLEASYPPTGARRRILEQALRVPHTRGIEYHYDLSNDFYRLFLDQDYMLYSCADFVGVSDTLETAQARKVSFIVDLVDPRPEERILEIGCGWGGMLRATSEKAGGGADLVGYTLSQEQAGHIRETSDQEVKVENFITADLGQDRYDAIYGVGALDVAAKEVVPGQS